MKGLNRPERSIPRFEPHCDISLFPSTVMKFVNPAKPVWPPAFPASPTQTPRLESNLHQPTLTATSKTFVARADWGVSMPALRCT